MIKLFYPDRQLSLIKNKIFDSITKTLNKSDFIQGNYVKNFEKLLAKKTNNRFAISCANGSDAISIALLSLNIKKNDIVYIPSFSFVSTVESIVNIGAIPRFIDVNPNNCLINLEYLERSLIKDNDIKNKYVMVVELFGGMPDYHKLLKLKKKYSFKLISDSAQSYGSKYNKKTIGNLVDVACLSFFPTKVLGCYGDGGALLTNKKNIAKKMKSLTQHGRGKTKYDNIHVGYNSRLDTLQAAILMNKMSLIKNEIKNRRNIALYYNKYLESKNVSILEYEKKVFSSYGYYTFICKTPLIRRRIISKLKSKKIAYAIYYPKPLHKLLPYMKYSKNRQSLINSENLAKKCLSIPIDPYLKNQEIDRIIKTINEI